MTHAASAPAIAETAPTSPVLTGYDRSHLITYLRLLDADEDGADWREVARIVLDLDPDRDEGRAWLTFSTHLQRARWMTENG